MVSRGLVKKPSSLQIYLPCPYLFLPDLLYTWKMEKGRTKMEMVGGPSPS